MNKQVESKESKKAEEQETKRKAFRDAYFMDEEDLKDIEEMTKARFLLNI